MTFTRICISLLLLATATQLDAQDAQPERRRNADTSQIDVIIEDAERQKIHVPDSLTMRVRVLAMEAFEPTQLRFKYGGWGTYGDRTYGYFWKPEKTTDEPPAFDLKEWTEHTPLKKFLPGGATNPRFMQVFCGYGGKVAEGRKPNGGRIWVGAAKGLKVEVEFYYEGKLLKSFVVEGPDAAIAPIVIPFGELTGDTKPTDPAFRDNLVPLLTWVRRKADRIASQPWADGPKPEKFAMVTNLGGYAQTNRLGSRHSDPAIVEQEVRVLRALGHERLSSRTVFSGRAPSFTEDLAVGYRDVRRTDV